MITAIGPVIVPCPCRPCRGRSVPNPGTTRVAPVIWLLVLAILVAGAIGALLVGTGAVRRAIPGVLEAWTESAARSGPR